MRARRRGDVAATLALVIGLVGLMSGNAHAAARACSLEIDGTWKSTDAAQPTLLTFTADGWVNVLGASPGARAEDLDILAQVRYELNDAREPSGLAFVTRRGNDLFPPGESSWEIEAYDDERFVTRMQDAPARWARVQTHRHFLTFADRAADPAERAILVAWTSLDGRRTDVAAFGLQQGRDEREPEFGGISADLVRELGGGGRESDVVLRVEINAAEYRRSLRVLEAWETLVSTGVLADDDPYRQTLDFLQTVLESVNRCRPKLLLRSEDTARLRDDSVAAVQRLHDVLRALRKENAAAHVGNAAFPAKWLPPALEP